MPDLGSPHLTLTLSAPTGRRGEVALRPLRPGAQEACRRQRVRERQSGDAAGGAPHQPPASSASMAAAFSPIMIAGALVLPEVSVGMIEASDMSHQSLHDQAAGCGFR